MATWKTENSMLTAIGVEILNKIKLGEGSITISRIVAGSGRVTATRLYQQTAVSGTQKNMTLTEVESIGNASEVSFFITNEENHGESEYYNLNQIGIYVTHPDYVGEQLYFITQCDEGTEDIIPPESVTPVKLLYSVILEHGNESSLSFTIDPLQTLRLGEFNEFKAEYEEYKTANEEDKTFILTEMANCVKDTRHKMLLTVDEDGSGVLVPSGKVKVSTSKANSLTVTDAIEHRALSLSVAGNSVQSSTPTPTAPVYPVHSTVNNISSGSDTIAFAPSIVLRSIGEHKDTIEWDGSKWWKVQRIAEVIVDGTAVSLGRPSFSNGSSYARASIYTPDGTGFKAFNDALPSSPVITSHGNSATHPSNSAKFYGYLEASSDVYRVHLHVLYSAIGLADGAKDATTRTNEVISWFKAQNTAGTPVRVMYVLANPIVTEIPITDVLNMYASSTQVRCSVTGSAVDMHLGYALNTTDDTIMYILKSLARKSDVQVANTFALATVVEEE